jgi:RsiW-degrading membrane proteinase PrsW (M82 family)
MDIIVSLISTVLCAVVYIRMVRRETPEAMPKKKAVIPVVAGLLAPFLATVVTLGIGLAIRGITGGRSLSEAIGNMALASLTGSFLAAGMTEELVKFLLFWLITRRLKPKNVYEYAVLMAGIGFGFTVLEEIGYGSVSPLISLSRLPGFAMHMVLGLIMGLFLGLARYKERGGIREHCLAFLLPILWHTVYDASTGFNGALSAEDENVQLIGIAFWLVVVIASTVLQFVVLIKFKKNAERYCAMEIRPQ